MKKCLVIFFLLTLSSVLFADAKDDAEDLVDKIDHEKITNEAKDAVNSSYNNYYDNRSKADNSSGMIMDYSGGGNPKAISDKLNPLLGDTPMKTLDGKKSFTGQLICAGQTEIGSITYTKQSGNRLSVQLNLGSYGMKVISNVSAICSQGVQSKSSTGNFGYAFGFTNGLLAVLQSSGLTDCVAIAVDRYQITEEDFDLITAQIIQLLATNGFDAVSGTENIVNADGSVNVRLFSQSSKVCGTENTTNESYGYTPTGSLYKPNTDGSISLPDGSSALMGSLNDNNSIYYFMNKSLDIEYKDGAKVGAMGDTKCTITNSILESGEYITDGGCSINPNTACSKVENPATGSALCYRPERVVAYKNGDGNITGSYSDVCGSYNLYVDSNPKKYFKFYMNGELKTSTLGEYKSDATMDSSDLSYMIESDDTKDTTYSIKFSTKFKKSDNFSVQSMNSCIEKKDDCKIISEKICNSAGKECVQTIKNGNKADTAPLMSEKRNLNGIEYTVQAIGSAFILSDGLSSRSIKTEDAYFYIEREYSCPNKNSSGLKDEEQSIDDILGSVGDGDYSNVKQDECAVQYCIVDRVEDNRAITDKTTGESRVDLGNSKSVIQEVRTCIPSGDKFICPTDTSKSEVIKAGNDCSCDTDKMLNTIGSTLAGLEVLKQISDKNAQKCGKK